MYEYDDAGDVTARGENCSDSNLASCAQTYTFTYDGDLQQRRAHAPDGSEEIYLYDPAGGRTLALSKNASGGYDRLRFWFGETEIWYGSESKEWVHLSHEVPIARIENGQNLEFTYHSVLGSLLASVDMNGNVTGGFTYGPWGEILDYVGQPAEHLRRFNGKEADQLSGLSYYGYRYYDPLSLSWSQSDPLYRFAPDAAWDQPRRMNRYSFSLENPLRYLDPDGQNPRDLWRSLRIPGAKDRTGIMRVVWAIRGSTSSDAVRAQELLPFLVRTLGLSTDRSHLPHGIVIERGIGDGLPDKNGNPTQMPAYAWTTQGDKIVFDLDTLASVNSPLDVALVMGVLVHEFVHAEGGNGESDSYHYEMRFYKELYNRGFIPLETLHALQSMTEEQIAHELSRLGVRGYKAPPKGKRPKICKECLKYGLNPNGWSPIGQPRPLIWSIAPQ